MVARGGIELDSYLPEFYDLSTLTNPTVPPFVPHRKDHDGVEKAAIETSVAMQIAHRPLILDFCMAETRMSALPKSGYSLKANKADTNDSQ